MKLGFSPKAQSDLENIGDYIARDNPARALTFLDEPRAACFAIAGKPEAYPIQPELGPSIRRAVHCRYLIFYSALPSEVRIERILHGARDIAGIPFDV